MFFSSFSFSLIDIFPFILLRVIIHLSLVHSKSFKDKSFTKFLSNLSLKDISILFFSKLTRFTFFSISYFNFASLFWVHTSKSSSNELIGLLNLGLTFVWISDFRFFSWDIFLIWSIELLLNWILFSLSKPDFDKSLVSIWSFFVLDETRCIKLVKNISIDKFWLETKSNSLKVLMVNCQYKTKTWLSMVLDISLILKNSWSFKEKFVLSNVK